MTSCLFPLLLSALFAQDPAAAAPVAPAAKVALKGDDASKTALVEACKAFADAKSYAFEVTTETTGMPGGGRFGGRGGQGGDAPPPPEPPRVPTKVSGQFQSGQPLHLMQGDNEAFIEGETMVHKGKDGPWEKLDREAMRARFGRGGRGGPGGGRGEGGGDNGGGAGGAGGAGGGEGRGARGPGGAGGPGGPGGGMMNLMGMMMTQPPHTLMKDIETKVSDVTRTEADGKVTFHGKLTPEAAAALGGGGMRGGRRGGGGGGGEGNGGGEGRGGGAGGGNRASTGTFEVVVGKDGAIESIHVDTTTKFSMGDQAVEFGRKAAYSIFDQGKAEVKVPDDAKKVMSEV